LKKTLDESTRNYNWFWELIARFVTRRTKDVSFGQMRNAFFKTKVAWLNANKFSHNTSAVRNQDFGALTHGFEQFTEAILGFSHPKG
jgi:hypothetical protein